MFVAAAGTAVGGQLGRVGVGEFGVVVAAAAAAANTDTR